jgi:hypothetical protein
MHKSLKNIIKEEIDDFDWIRQQGFHLDLMSQNTRKVNSLSEVKKILFNPAVMTSDQKFKNVVYYLEDMDYMPENLVYEYLSYVEIKKQPQSKGLFVESGKFFVGPTINDEELIEMSKEDGSFWYEEFIGTFLPHKLNG